MAVIADVRALDVAGDLTALTDPQVQSGLDRAECHVSSEALGDCYDTAHALLAAHWLARSLQGANATGGPLVSAAAGGLSAGYAIAGDISLRDLMSTSFGAEYARLIQARVSTLRVLL